MIVFYIPIAVFIAWIWIEYFRLIDIFEKEKLKYIIYTFLWGGASTSLILGLDFLFNKSLRFDFGPGLFGELLYWTVNVGLVEEMVKIAPFTVIYYLYRKQINEPVDFLIYFAVSALGFASVENFLYMQEFGYQIISGRSILSTLGHMIDTSFIAYGVILYKYRKYNFLIIPLFILLAAVVHGIYNFIISYADGEVEGLIILIPYFFITVSVFAVILNNALNNSPFFSYKKILNSYAITKRMMLYFGIIFLLQFIFLVFYKDITYASNDFFYSAIFFGFVIFVCVFRLSRFKLVEGRWERLKIELPFTIVFGSHHYAIGPNIHFKIKGDSAMESRLNFYYKEYFWLCPISKKQTYIGKPRLAYLEKNIFLRNYSRFFLARVYKTVKDGDYEEMLLQPKIKGACDAYGAYPLVAILRIDSKIDMESRKLKARDFRFREWAYVKPLKTDSD